MKLLAKPKFWDLQKTEFISYNLLPLTLSSNITIILINNYKKLSNKKKD